MINDVTIVNNDFHWECIADLPHIRLPICIMAQTALQEIAQVSKKWREMAYDPLLYKRIVPADCFGENEWLKYIGKAEKEKLPPLCVFKDIARAKGYLHWCTETVIIACEDGSEKTVVVNPKTLGKLVEKPKEGHKAGYSEESMRDVIKYQFPQEKSHWVWIEQEPLGDNQNFEEHQSSIEKKITENKETNWAHVAKFQDVLQIAFMEKIRSGKSPLVPRLWIGVNLIEGRRIWVGSKDDGLVVECFANKAVPQVAALVARKSFGREP